MATTIDATIQNRRGAYANYDPTKQVAGEFAVVQSGDPNTLDGKALYVHMTSGANGKKRIVTADEIDPLMVEIRQAVQTVEEDTEKAEESATLSESWAIGGTGERQGEDTNNSKYFSEKSEEAWEDIQDAIDRTIPTVSINFQTGILSYTGSFFDLRLNKLNGMLEWYLPQSA